jgi:hypothetical protein
MIFSISDKDKQEIDDWQHIQKLKSNTGATIGGRWTYSFTPTSIGVFIEVEDNETGDVLSLDSNF